LKGVEPLFMMVAAFLSLLRVSVKILARTFSGHVDPGTYGLLFGLSTCFASRIVDPRYPSISNLAPPPDSS
jgi:hypothetical protein